MSTSTESWVERGNASIVVSGFDFDFDRLDPLFIGGTGGSEPVSVTCDREAFRVFVDLVLRGFLDRLGDPSEG